MLQRSRKRLGNKIEHQVRLADPAAEERRDRPHVAVIQAAKIRRDPAAQQLRVYTLITHITPYTVQYREL